MPLPSPKRASVRRSITQLTGPEDPIHAAQLGRRSIEPSELRTPFELASIASWLNSGASCFWRNSALTTSPVSAYSATTFFQLNTLRASANSVQSVRPSENPLLTRMSTFLVHGIVELLIGSIWLPTIPKP